MTYIKSWIRSFFVSKFIFKKLYFSFTNMRLADTSWSKKSLNKTKIYPMQLYKNYPCHKYQYLYKAKLDD